MTRKMLERETARRQEAKREVSTRVPAAPAPFVGWRRVLEWALLPLAFVLMRFVPDRPAGVGGWSLLLVAGVLFASPTILASYRAHLKDRAASSAEDLAVEYRTRLALTLGEAVIPMGDLLGRIVLAGASERSALQGQLRQRVVDAAVALAGPDGARAVFFGLEGRTLRTVAWAGRPDPPVGLIDRTTPAGEAVYGLLASRSRIVVPDTRRTKAVDPGFGGNSYATYLAVAVYAGAKNLGILVVDALEPDALDSADVDMAAALAQALGPGLAVR